jgi:hypothetical protein
MVIIVMVIIIMVMVPGTILGNTSSAEGNLCLGRFPIADALQFSRVVVLFFIKTSGDYDNTTPNIPAAVWNIILFHLGSDCTVADQDKTGESEELLGAHDD